MKNFRLSTKGVSLLILLFLLNLIGFITFYLLYEKNDALSALFIFIIIDIFLIIISRITMDNLFVLKTNNKNLSEKEFKRVTKEVTIILNNKYKETYVFTYPLMFHELRFAVELHVPYYKYDHTITTLVDDTEQHFKQLIGCIPVILVKEYDESME